DSPSTNGYQNGHENGAEADVAPAPSELNARFRFSSFVVGHNSQFAHAAAKAVAEAPGDSYNPLFLYGGVGLGKTHLMHAIGHEVHDRFPRKRVVYLTSEQFTNEVISSIATARMGEFRHKYRTVDVLLIDDVLFLRPVFPREELNVVDEQHVDRAVLVPELAHASSGDGADHLVGELLRRQVDDALAREAVVHLMADGVHQVRLAQAHPSVEEQ